MRRYGLLELRRREAVQLALFSGAYNCRLERTSVVDDGNNRVATLCKDLTNLSAMVRHNKQLETSAPGELPMFLAPFKKTPRAAAIPEPDLQLVFMMEVPAAANHAITGPTAQQRAVASQVPHNRRRQPRRRGGGGGGSSGGGGRVGGSGEAPTLTGSVLARAAGVVGAPAPAAPVISSIGGTTSVAAALSGAVPALRGAAFDRASAGVGGDTSIATAAAAAPSTTTITSSSSTTSSSSQKTKKRRTTPAPAPAVPTGNGGQVSNRTATGSITTAAANTTNSNRKKNRNDDSVRTGSSSSSSSSSSSNNIAHGGGGRGGGGDGHRGGGGGGGGGLSAHQLLAQCAAEERQLRNR